MPDPLQLMAMGGSNVNDEPVKGKAKPKTVNEPGQEEDDGVKKADGCHCGHGHDDTVEKGLKKKSLSRSRETRLY